MCLKSFLDIWAFFDSQCWKMRTVLSKLWRLALSNIIPNNALHTCQFYPHERLARSSNQDHTRVLTRVSQKHVERGVMAVVINAAPLCQPSKSRGGERGATQPLRHRTVICLGASPQLWEASDSPAVVVQGCFLRSAVETRSQWPWSPKACTSPMLPSNSEAFGLRATLWQQLMKRFNSHPDYTLKTLEDS